MQSLVELHRFEITTPDHFQLRPPLGCESATHAAADWNRTIAPIIADSCPSPVLCTLHPISTHSQHTAAPPRTPHLLFHMRAFKPFSTTSTHSNHSNSKLLSAPRAAVIGNRIPQRQQAYSLSGQPRLCRNVPCFRLVSSPCPAAFENLKF